MKIGIPENPEIIEPGQTRPTNFAPIPGRFRRALQIFVWMIKIAVPALFLDSICVWLFQQGQGEGSVFAWVLLVLFAPPATLATLVTGVVELVLGFFFFATLFGKAVTMTNVPFAKFVRYPGSNSERFPLN